MICIAFVTRYIDIMQMCHTFFKEIVFISLVLFLPSVKCVDSRKVSFQVENGKIIMFKDATVGPFQVKSTVECATMCIGDASCCTASYDEITNQCLLSSLCYPETVISNSGKYILNRYKVGRYSFSFMLTFYVLFSGKI